jgi:NAD(P)H-hydrate epimerase
MDAVVTPAEMAAVDAAAPEPTEVLIERAAGAVAREALDLLGGAYGRRVVVVAGPGNNGADGRAAARRLEARGVRCRVFPADRAPAELPPADLVVDAAFGTGFRGSYHAPVPADPATPVLAVDIPSGIDGLTGVASGAPLRATRTVTFQAWKPGLLLADGAHHSGSVRVADIGLDVSDARAHVVDDRAAAGWMPTRRRDAHKWQAALRLVAGSPGMTGAANLAAAAAMRSGAGYVRLSTPGAAGGQPAPTECVVTGLPADGWVPEVLHDLDRFGALAVGPGLGRHATTAAQVRLLVAETSRPTVVDGDGLAALADHPVQLRSDDGTALVLTPHDGEFSALCGSPPGPDRFDAARDLARRTGAVVLLKGPATLVADPDGTVLVVTAGDPRLATAGTGDVLTGILGALLAQGAAPFEAAACAAHLHGRSGALAWRHGLVASDLVDHLPAALNALLGA